MKNYKLYIGLCMVGLIGILVVVSIFYIPYPVNEIDTGLKLNPPSFMHLLGTDQFGRDIFSRLIYGLRISLLLGMTVVICGLLLGLIIGSLSGYYGGKLDEIIMKLIDVQMAFPGVLLALVIIAIYKANFINLIIALTIMSIPRFTRVIRSGYMKYRDTDFVKAARSRGASDISIMYQHILPNLSYELLVTASLSLASAIMSEAGLSYLGLGIQPPNPSLGMMLSEGQDYILQAPWYVTIVALIIIILVMGFNFIGDGLQEKYYGS